MLRELIKLPLREHWARGGPKQNVLQNAWKWTSYALEGFGASKTENQHEIQHTARAMTASAATVMPESKTALPPMHSPCHKHHWQSRPCYSAMNLAFGITLPAADAWTRQSELQWKLGFMRTKKCLYSTWQGLGEKGWISAIVGRDCPRITYNILPCCNMQGTW